MASCGSNNLRSANLLDLYFGAVLFELLLEGLSVFLADTFLDSRRSLFDELFGFL